MFLALWSNYHYLLCSITAAIKTFKLALRRVTCLGTTETQKHIAWCISCCISSQLRSAAPVMHPEPALFPLLSRSCWPVEGDLGAQAGKDFSTAGMESGTHTWEENCSLTSTDQKTKLFNLVVMVVGFGGHISTMVLWQTYPGHCKDRGKYL